MVIFARMIYSTVAVKLLTKLENLHVLQFINCIVHQLMCISFPFTEIDHVVQVLYTSAKLRKYYSEKNVWLR